MELQLENLQYQETAINSVVQVFDGTEKNTFDKACCRICLPEALTPPPTNCDHDTKMPRTCIKKVSWV